MNLAHYLRRIGFTDTVSPTYPCFAAIHRAHALSVPYENLDVQLGRHLDFDLERIFDKIVTRSRGGWCYETHLLFEWALREIGFDTLQVVAGIYRREHGDETLGCHTAILVHLHETYLADLGLGDCIREPIPLLAGTYTQGPLSFRLELLDDGYWRFHNHALAYPCTFDFRVAPADWLQIGFHNNRQQTDPASTLVANLVCQIMKPESVTCLTGRLLREKSQSGMTKRLLSEDEFELVLNTTFGLQDNDFGSLWPRVAARHEVLFGDQAAAQIDFRGF